MDNSDGTDQRKIPAEAYGQALDIVSIMGGSGNIIPLGQVGGRVVVMMRDPQKLDDEARDIPLLAGSLHIDVGDTSPGDVLTALRELVEDNLGGADSKGFVEAVREAKRNRRERMAEAKGRLDDGTPYITQRMLDNGISTASMGKPLCDEPFETRAWRMQAGELQEENERLRRELADARAQVDALRHAERLRTLEEKSRESCEGILPERAEAVLSELEERVSAMLDGIQMARLTTGELSDADLDVASPVALETIC